MTMMLMMMITILALTTQVVFCAMPKAGKLHSVKYIESILWAAAHFSIQLIIIAITEYDDNIAMNNTGNTS